MALPLPLVFRLWRRLPVVVRAVVVGEIVATVGGFLPELFILGNLKLSPTVPWLLPATAVWLWLFWQYLNGKGWPRSTSQARRRALRARPISSKVWRWSLLAGGLGIVSAIGLSFVTVRLANVPRDAYKIPVDFSIYPTWTVVSVLFAISAVAGVVEEGAFRGYMLSLIQRRHGWIAGILVTGFMFFVSHLNHAYVTLAFLPFFLAVSTVHGLLVYLTRSILPSVVLHGVADVFVLPVQYGVLMNLSVAPVWKTGMDSAFVIYVSVTVLFGLAAIPAFRRLATIPRAEHRSYQTGKPAVG